MVKKFEKGKKYISLKANGGGHIRKKGTIVTALKNTTSTHLHYEGLNGNNRCISGNKSEFTLYENNNSNIITLTL